MGQEVLINHTDLSYSLVKIEAYSPMSETSLFWYDTYKGIPHGISMNFLPTTMLKKKMQDFFRQILDIPMLLGK